MYRSMFSLICSRFRGFVGLLFVSHMDGVTGLSLLSEAGLGTGAVEGS